MLKTQQSVDALTMSIIGVPLLQNDVAITDCQVASPWLFSQCPAEMLRCQENFLYSVLLFCTTP